MSFRRIAVALLAIAALTAGCSHKKPESALPIVSLGPFASDGASSSPGATPSVTSSVDLPGSSPSHSPRVFGPGGGGTTSAPSTTKPSSFASVKITTSKVVSLEQPIAMAVRHNDPSWYVAEKTGKVVAVKNGTVYATVVDLSGTITTGAPNEQGLLGLTFNPAGNRMYVYYTDRDGSHDVVRQYVFSGGHVSSPATVISIADPESNHNGGNIMFGPDGYLYIGTGDGGGAGDAHGATGNGQNINALLGKMLRIAPKDGGGYTNPSSNPFVGKDGADEVYAYGLRNPWRWSFDRSTHDLWIGDVGQGAWEEVDFDAANTPGDNYGWRRMEGSHSYNGGTPPPNHHGPIYEMSHADGYQAVTGGFVYRGAQIPALRGAYVFGDFYVGKLEAFVRSGGRATQHRFLGPHVDQLASFAEDQDGELYALSLAGAIYRIDAA